MFLLKSPNINGIVIFSVEQCESFAKIPVRYRDNKVLVTGGNLGAGFIEKISSSCKFGGLQTSTIVQAHSMKLILIYDKLKKILKFTIYTK